MQASLFAEIDLRAKQDPIWATCFAIPNGGHRDVRVAKKLKAEGVKPGVPDLMWPIVRGRYHGLFMELKVKPNKPTALQEAFIFLLQYQGYFVATVYDDPAEAMKILDWYYDGANT